MEAWARIEEYCRSVLNNEHCERTEEDEGNVENRKKKSRKITHEDIDAKKSVSTN